MLCARCGKEPRYRRYLICKTCRNKERRERWAAGLDRPDATRRRAYDQARYSARRQKARAEMFEHYGKKCSCCGEDEELFLTLDHINGRDEGETLGGAWMYEKAKREGWPEIYRVLCWNCNAAIGLYGFCPHNMATERS